MELVCIFHTNNVINPIQKKSGLFLTESEYKQLLSILFCINN